MSQTSKFQLLVIRLLLVIISHMELNRQHNSKYPVPEERTDYDANIQKDAVGFIVELTKEDTE